MAQDQQKGQFCHFHAIFSLFKPYHRIFPPPFSFFNPNTAATPFFSLKFSLSKPHSHLPIIKKKKKEKCVLQWLPHQELPREWLVQINKGK
jgi:hypothetical protein